MNIRLSILFYLIVLFCIFTLGKSNAQTNTLGSNIYTPILIEGISLKASGVYWVQDNYMYLLTAKHVLLDTITDSLKNRFITLTSHSGRDNSETCILELDLKSARLNRNMWSHKVRDIVIVRIAHDTLINNKIIPMYFPHVNVKIVPKSGEIIVAIAVTSFDSVIISNDAYVLGYPGSIGVPEVLQLDYSQPLIKRGIVSGKNYKNRTIIIDCPTYPGNSGSPVYEVDNNELGRRSMRLIGIVSEYIPFKETWKNTVFKYENEERTNSGYSVVETVDLAIELVKSN